MINKYVCSVSNDGQPELKVYVAKNYESVKEHLRHDYDVSNEYDDLDWDDFINQLIDDKNIYIGEIYDIEEL